MANDTFTLGSAAPRQGEPLLLPSFGFIGLLLLVFVGLNPFAPLPTTTAAAAQSAHGDSLRQILYLLVLAPIGLAAVMRQGGSAMRAIPASLLILLGWCALSAAWSSVPDVTLRRTVLASIIVMATMLSVTTLGPERAFRYWRLLMVGILVMNWLSIPLVSTSVHLAGETDPNLVGDWRGIYGQKNTAGAMCALTVLLFLLWPIEKQQWVRWAVVMASLGFLVMSRSKTSMGLLPVALAAGLAYRLAWRDGLGRAIFACLCLTGFAALAAIVMLDSADILRILENPSEFTGRAEIWQASFAFLRDHPLFGAGFGTVANTGTLSPLHNYVRSGWVEAIGDSHNGYLQLLVTIGGIGFTIAMAALLIVPLARFWTLTSEGNDFRSLLFAIFVFFVLHNFMESDFLENDNGIWLAFLMVLTSLRIPNKSLTAAF